LRSTAEFVGIGVLGGKRWMRRVGKVRRALLFPDGSHLAGYLVKRGDLLWMIKRPDRFFAWDSFQVVDGRIVVDGHQSSWDSSACRRLGLDWDTALLVEGMPVLTAAGGLVGKVDAVEYNEHDGGVRDFMVSGGAGSKALLGSRRVPLANVERFADAQLWLSQGFVPNEAEGGLAAHAGKQVAVIGNAVKEKTDAAGRVAGEVAEKAGKGVEKLGYKTGKAIGKAKRSLAERRGDASAGTAAAGTGTGKLVETGSKVLKHQVNRTTGMFKAFRDEYKNARHPESTATGGAAKSRSGEAKKKSSSAKKSE